MLGNNSSFIPHFVAREVKKRNDWVTSKDIQKHLTAISEAQEKMKIAERKVISDHDYTHILTYFQTMSHLRSLETACREFLISELEIARSHLDSDVENIHLSRELLKDCELQFVRVSEALNKQLAYTESACTHRVQENVKLQSEIMRLNDILDTYINAENNRQEVDGGVLGGLKLREMDQCHPLVQQLARKMMSYKDIRDDHDDQLRQRSRCHVHEINLLRAQKVELEAELDSIHEYKQAQSEFVKKLMSEFVLTNRKAIKAENVSEKKIEVLGKLVNKQSSKAGKVDLMIRKTKPLLVSGTRHSNEALSSLCLFLLKQFELIRNSEENSVLLENIEMAKEDQRSYLAAQQRLLDEDRRRRHQEQLAQEGAAAKGKSKSTKGKGSKSAKLVAKSPSKAGVAGGGSTTSSRPTSKASNTKPSKPSKK
ncbi:hypothetical protein EON65_22415 [archaeon]|nr:MAG: hypothetical protein EON65_22415 [archaeon]